MVFNSISFLIFFPVVVSLYFFSPHKFRWAILLIASCTFYMMYIPIYILVLALLIVIDYFAGIKIEQSKGRMRKLFLLVSVTSNVLILFSFKYFNFFAQNFSQIAHILGFNYSIGVVSILLPIGLSFHTFQSLSYVIEVYRGKQKAERHFGIYALYVLFFPQLVAGPIERPQHLLPQFYTEHILDYNEVKEGLKRMVFGFFKKTVIADRLALIVNEIFSHPSDYTGGPLMIAVLAFAFQIYCDFSGYSDIAIGSARVLGFKLGENFNYPYLAGSITDFWRRWHMSLYSWFRDYIYIPLGGNRGSMISRHRNILITFTLSGLWHGAQWTYVLWGVLHGIYMIFFTPISNAIFYVSNILNFKVPQEIRHIISVFSTFILVCISWILFRSNSISDAQYILSHIFVDMEKVIQAIFINDSLSLNRYIFDQGKGIGLSQKELIIALISLCVMGLYEWYQRTQNVQKLIHFLRYGLYIAFLLAIINLSITKKTPFIYFQF